MCVWVYRGACTCINLFLFHEHDLTSPPCSRFLDIVQSLSSYGSHIFKVKDKKEGIRYIAVGRDGVKIFRPDNRLAPFEVKCHLHTYNILGHMCVPLR